MYICALAKLNRPPLNAIGLPNIAECLLSVRSPALFISAIGEIASAYVVSNRVRRIRNGNPN